MGRTGRETSGQVLAIEISCKFFMARRPPVVKILQEEGKAVKIWAWVWLGLMAALGWAPALLVSYMVALALAVGGQVPGRLAFTAVYLVLLGVAVFLLEQVRRYFSLTGRFTLVGGAILVAVWVIALLVFTSMASMGPDVLLSDIGRQRPGTAQLVQGYWVARLPTGEFRVYMNVEPHSGQPLYWWPSDHEVHVDWQALWRDGSFFREDPTPKDHFGSPVYGEVYSIDGRCVGGPCDQRGLIPVPAAVRGKRLVLVGHST